MAVPSTWGEPVVASRERSRHYIRGEREKRVYHVPDTTTWEAIKAALPTGSVLEGSGEGLWKPRLETLESREHPTQKGLLVVEAVWDPPDWNRVIEDNPGHGVLMLDIGGEVRPWQKDVYGSDLESEWLDDDGTVHRYRIVEGAAVRFLARCDLVLDVAVTAVAVQSLMALYGRCNNGPLPNFGGAAAETLLFLGAKSQRVLVPNQLWRIRYGFRYDPDGWRRSLKVRQETLAVTEQPVYDADGADTGRKRTVELWQKVGADQPRETTNTGDFGIIQAMLEW